MKLFITLLTIFSIFSMKAFSQETPAIEVVFESASDKDKALSDGFNADQIAAQVEQSRADLIESVGAEEAEKMVPVGVTYMMVDELIEELTRERALETSACAGNQAAAGNIDLEKEINRLRQVMADAYSTGPKGVLFITWGYNRGFHSNSDITVRTEQGSYTIRNAVGEDRPSPLSLKYLKPSNFSVPQYNLKLGYWFSRDSKFGIGVGTDHMKWVFDPSREYDIEGDYTGELWVDGERRSFDEIVAGRDASFLLLEHTDGYNYPYIEGLYREKLVDTRRFGIDAVAGAGAGILFPKTRTRIADQADTAGYRDIDNKFHVAGYAFHVDASLMFKYKQKNGVSYFVKPTVRGVAGKINNALYFGDEGSIEQSMIYTLEPSLSVGMEVPLNVINNEVKRGARRELRVLRRMQKLDEEEAKELSLEEMQRQFEESQRSN
tara:strand:- start:8336 stop:9643 length:1308 start_codon:yes stop_codon:yes gene_type:complete